MTIKINSRPIPPETPVDSTNKRIYEFTFSIEAGTNIAADNEDMARKKLDEIKKGIRKHFYLHLNGSAYNLGRIRLYDKVPMIPLKGIPLEKQAHYVI